MTFIMNARPSADVIIVILLAAPPILHDGPNLETGSHGGVSHSQFLLASHSDWLEIRSHASCVSNTATAPLHTSPAAPSPAQDKVKHGSKFTHCYVFFLTL